ncbi:MAG: hypothetical protein HYW25_01860 [Candidatus Aenigmarchaeota archaeon]|nr:hypothetical protein [Candidatus Aenigmarchaeota archaeon]
MGLSNMKGISYSIEAVIAVLIIASAALPLLSLTSVNTDHAKQHAYQNLQYLSADPQLREFVFEDNANGIKSMLEGFFDDYEFEICNPECTGAKRTARETIIADWHFAGYRNVNQPRTLRIYLFG